MSQPAFNVSLGLDVACVMNTVQAELLSRLIFDIAETPEILALLHEFWDGYGEDGQSEGKLPSSLFALAKSLEKQVSASRKYKRSRSKKTNRQSEEHAA
jgi:hypothetical protein